MNRIRTLCTLLIISAFGFVLSNSVLAQSKEKKMKDVLVAPEIIDFKLIKVGKSAAQPAMITNKNKSAIKIKGAKRIKPPYTIEGIKFPLTIASGQTANLKLIFKRTKPEEYKGQISLQVSEAGELFIYERGK